MISDFDVLGTLSDGTEIKFSDFLKDPYCLRKIPDLFSLTLAGVSIYRTCLALIPLYGYSDAVLAELMEEKKRGNITFSKEAAYVQ